MSSPSKLSLIVSLTVTAGLFYGGARLASELGEPSTPTDPPTRPSYIPAPVPGSLEEKDTPRSDTMRPHDQN